MQSPEDTKLMAGEINALAASSSRNFDTFEILLRDLISEVESARDMDQMLGGSQRTKEFDRGYISALENVRSLLERSKSRA